MNNIEITYKSYKITFREDLEEWSCRELEIDANKSLASIKAAIDRLSAKDRRVDVAALMLQGGGGRFRNDAMVENVTVTILCQPPKKVATFDRQKCWIKDSKGERHKVNLDQLYPVDTLADLKGWLALEDAAKAAQALATSAVEALTPFNVDTLALAAREAKAPKEDA